MGFDDISEKEISKAFDEPKPYVKCNNCGADIRLDIPERVLECTYSAIDEFEKRLQEKQRSPLLPVLRLWQASPMKYRGHYVAVLCARGCAAGAQRFRLDKVLWY